MKIRSITVTAGRVLPHPLQDYANIRPELTLQADLEEGENAEAAARALQGKAESLLEQHAADLSKFLKDQEARRQRAVELRDIRDRIQRDKERLAKLIDDEKRDTSDPTVGMLQERIAENTTRVQDIESAEQQVS